MTASTAAAPSTSTGESINSAKATRATITTGGLGRGGGNGTEGLMLDCRNRRFVARRLAARARKMSSAINTTPTATRTTKKRKATSTIVQSSMALLRHPVQDWLSTNAQAENLRRSL